MKSFDPIVLGCNFRLTADELSLLSTALPEPCNVKLGAKTVEPSPVIRPQVVAGSNRSTTTSSTGMQYAFGMDLTTMFAVALSPLPAFFLKKLTEDVAVTFWKSLKALIERVSGREKASQIRSAQLSIPLETYRRVSIICVITHLNIRFSDDSQGLAIIGRCIEEATRRVAEIKARIDNDASVFDRVLGHFMRRREIRIHILVNGEVVNSQIDP